MQGVILFKKFFQKHKTSRKVYSSNSCKGRKNLLQKLNPTITVGYIKCKNKNKI